MKFEEKKFDIGKLKGISEKNIEEHLKLYAGYVKHSNLILEKIEEMKADSDPSNPSGQANAYALAEVQRRFGFEYNGMRNHEIYFGSLENGSASLTTSGPLEKQIEKDFGSFETWQNIFKSIGLTRGIGWAILYWDRKDERLLNAWIDEQHLGQLQDCASILALDMWEHSYVADYQPSGKKQYIEDFFKNLNWETIEKNFSSAS